MSRSDLRGHFIIMTLFGIIFLSVGLFSAVYMGTKQTRLEKRCTEKTIGVVTDYYTEGLGDNTTYNITVEYVIDGRKITEKQSSKAAIGYSETKEVWYDPDDHSVVYIDGVDTPSYSWVICGSIFAVLGAWLLVTVYRWLKRR
ncbi:DUF3592 domain-containing protein [Ruminococcus sp.]|uniref:DUF3592 domain-containing protein n=1 Tax=Ruminococcus sp. TaxID=41978 RepID=UPI0025F1F37B|nr:DUF3592 domain-containing protein [Ruminococcus sp.]MBQ8965766.1 DUF3592 domain-containing protein [Ruminococcus sp.]